jgi:serine/threonine-protein kinase
MEMAAITKVGRYEIAGELGRGGMGIVYRAKDPVIDRTVAVKTMRLTEEGSKMSREELLQRFLTEARVAGLLAHPNIVVVYDAGEEEGLYYITMELVEGKSLQRRMDAGEKFPVPRILRIMEQVCSALQFAHDHKVVHRDIKPANIMLTDNDTVKVTDFGTAKILQYGGAQHTAAMGTPGYMSPEQIKGRGVNQRTDIFALGVMLYEMVIGEKPFSGGDIPTILYRILNQDPPPPNTVDPTIHPGISSTIMRALSKSPSERYQNCAELLEDLREYRPGGRGAKDAAPSRVAMSLGASEARKGSFQAEMPQIPGVDARKARGTGGEAAQQAPARDFTKLRRAAEWGVGLLIVGLIAFISIRIIEQYQPRVAGQGGSVEPTTARNEAPQASQAEPQAEPEAAPTLAVASPVRPEIASLDELASPWSSKEFRFQARANSGYVPAMIVRLPGAAAQSDSYWAFSLAVPFSQCRYEYIQDLDRLAAEYKVAARHAMVGNPCSHTVFDPTQLKELPGNILVRGAVVRGWDARPPLGIEVRITGNHVIAIRME